MKLALLIFTCLVTSGCASLSPELIEALARDDASICARADTRGGVGSIMAPSGGYGQATLELCRSRFPNAKVTLHADGSISIEHGGH